MTAGEIEAYARSRGLVEPRVIPLKQRGGNVKYRMVAGARETRRVVADWERGADDAAIRSIIDAVG